MAIRDNPIDTTIDTTIEEIVKEIADSIYYAYGSETRYLFGIEPKHEKAVRSIIKLAITKYKEVYLK